MSTVTHLGPCEWPLCAVHHHCERGCTNAQVEAARHKLTTGAQPAPAAPSGYKLVPLEPTEAMVSAALNCQDADPEDGPPADVYCQWRAMLDAAPAAQPADSAMLREVDAALRSAASDYKAQGAYKDAGYFIDLADRARALTAASKERSDRGI